MNFLLFTISGINVVININIIIIIVVVVVVVVVNVQHCMYIKPSMCKNTTVR